MKFGSLLMVYLLIILSHLYLHQCLPNESHNLYLSVSSYFALLMKHAPGEETTQVGQILFFHRLDLHSRYHLLLLHLSLLEFLFQLSKYSCHASNNFEWYSLIILRILPISTRLNPPLLCSLTGSSQNFAILSSRST